MDMKINIPSIKYIAISYLRFAKQKSFLFYLKHLRKRVYFICQLKLCWKFFYNHSNFQKYFHIRYYNNYLVLTSFHLAMWPSNNCSGGGAMSGSYKTCLIFIILYYKNIILIFLKLTIIGLGLWCLTPMTCRKSLINLIT